MTGHVPLSTIKDSSFVNCRSSCISVRNSNNVTIVNNVLYESRAIGAKVSGDVKLLIFTNNLIIGVSQGSYSNVMLACFVHYGYNDPLLTKIIRDNICQGSVGYGFVFPHVKCS